MKQYIKLKIFLFIEIIPIKKLQNKIALVVDIKKLSYDILNPIHKILLIIFF